jgi:NAD(P)H dehydrogenase (quinone)
MRGNLRTWRAAWVWLTLPILAAAAQAARAGETPAPMPPAAAPGEPATRVLVVYYSMTGTTEKLAQGVAEGSQQVAGTLVTIKRVEEVSKAELEAADAIALGCPAYFGNIPGRMKTMLDDWNWKWKVNFTDKVGGGFATGGGQVGGKEHVVISLLVFMINNRMVVAGPLYEDAQGEDIWGEIGAAAMTGPLDPGVSDQELDGARRLGERLARLAQRLRTRPP